MEAVTILKKLGGFKMRVKIFPENTGISASKCDHRFGAVMTFSHQTDSRFQNSIYAAELYGFRNNVRLGCFATNLLGQYNTGIPEAEATGLMRHDVYFGVDFWQNPVNGNIELIPDYYLTTWTAAGATYFNVTAGAIKAARYPSHGQNMFDITAGALGYDFVNGVMGGNNLEEVNGVEESQQNWLHSLVGRYPSTGSYRVGDNRGWYTHLEKWIGLRNSIPSPSVLSNPAPTQYGSNLGSPSVPTDRETFINYPNSFRWWDSIHNDGNSKSAADAYMVTHLGLTLANHGWYRDFCHWHSAQANGTLPEVDGFLALFRDTVEGNFVWTCSNGEAIEYLFVRETADRIVAVDKNGSITIVVDVVDEFKNLNTAGLSQRLALDRMNTPLSVQINLSGTSLEGKNIISSFSKVINLGEDEYVIQVPFNNRELFQTVTLTEGNGGEFDTSRPTAVIDITGNIMTVTTNIPTKSVLFGVATGGADFQSLPISRSNILKAIHIFEIASGFEYRIGIVSEFGMANLIDV